MCVSYRTEPTDQPIQSETEHEKFCHRKIQNPSVYSSLFFRAGFSHFISMFCCLRFFPLAACVYICCWCWWCWWCGIFIVLIFRSYVFASFFKTIDRINIEIWFIISHRLRFQGVWASLCVVVIVAIGKLIYLIYGQLNDAIATFWLTIIFFLNLIWNHIFASVEFVWFCCCLWTPFLCFKCIINTWTGK